MNGGIHIPQAHITLYGGGCSLACDTNGQIEAHQLHGLFAADTRVISSYRLAANGHAWRLLGRSRLGHGTAQWEFENTNMRDPGGDILPGELLLSLRRRVDGVMHDDLSVQTFGTRQYHIRLTLLLDADFADIFEVKARSIAARLEISRLSKGNQLTLDYQRRGFKRGLRVNFYPNGSRPSFVGALVMFDLEIDAGHPWICCLDAEPIVDGQVLCLSGDPHATEPNPVPDPSRLILKGDDILQRPFAQARIDLHSLAISQQQKSPYVAAGVPWFFTLFGRDSLLTALMSGLEGAWPSVGALTALSRYQGTRYNNFSDEEPGKIAHELRNGELTRSGTLPYSPYYGTHDAPALFCLTLWQAWRLTGDKQLLADFFDSAQKALHWCDTLGDRDQDGLQEYATRSAKGYRNQGWKDSGDAIVHANGAQPTLPLATLELQAYWYAACLAMAELLDARGEAQEAQQRRLQAQRLRERIEECYWLEDQRFYALALDQTKQTVAGISSNPGHLLWCGVPSSSRAIAVTHRLLEPDMFSGWGLRTLSAENPAYNPLAYQRGSVWPHDTVIACAGMWRYGLRDQASVLLKALLEAAAAFEEYRLPELFCGLNRCHGLPVPYEEANSPQAWSAAAPMLAAQLFLSFVPDAPHKRAYVAPWLPDWLPMLEIQGIGVGEGRFDVILRREGDNTVTAHFNSINVEVIRDTPQAPLWGAPLLLSSPH